MVGIVKESQQSIFWVRKNHGQDQKQKAEIFSSLSYKITNLKAHLMN